MQFLPEDADEGPVREESAWLLTVAGQTTSSATLSDFTLANISAPDLFGPGGPGTAPDFLADDFTRVTGTATIDGRTYYAFSPEPFQIRQGETYIVPELTITPIPPPLPRSLRIESERSVIPPGDSVQLVVTGTIGDGSEADLTPRLAWTTYRTSNPRVASVSKDGLVTANDRGTAYITAVNEGATAVKRFDVAKDTVRIRISGIVRLPDGTAAAGASVRTPFGDEVLAGPDGAFAFDVEVPLGAAFSLVITFESGGRQFSRTVRLEALERLETVDLGPIVLVEASSDLFPGRVFATGAIPRSVASGDLDGDGDADLTLANNGSNTVSVLLNQGDGTFAAHVQYGVGVSPVSVALGDHDGDGDADLAVVNGIAGSRTVSVHRNQGDGTFAAHVQHGVGSNPWSVALGDLDGDGDADLAVANFTSHTVSVLLNQSVR